MGRLRAAVDLEIERASSLGWVVFSRLSRDLRVVVTISDGLPHSRTAPGLPTITALASDVVREFGPRVWSGNAKEGNAVIIERLQASTRSVA
ncbi:hypothetical protein CKO40_17870 [Halochromatium glycolicum]|uniref:Uncharacterized protein n=1 Tax=Halochromatium glycolicum TaxID=85075 RepID=A0AAJ0U6T6_9GAMM|nr:hypothetical protein [Halochromatium glycolicum]